VKPKPKEKRKLNLPKAERPYRGKIPAQTSHEFMVDEQGQMRHIRSGIRVAQFELTGNRPNGKPVLMKFQPNQAGWTGFWLAGLVNESRWARLANLERVPIEKQKVKH
jgi:hypothetical protein